MAAMALALVAGGARAEAPDLAVRRDGLVRHGDSLHVVVENLGSARSAATVLRASDRPFLGGPRGTESHYRPSRGTEAMWIDRAAVDSLHTRVTFSFGRGLDPIASAGEIRFPPGSAPRTETGAGWPAGQPGALRTQGDLVAWDLELPSEGASFSVVAAVTPGADASALLLYRPQQNRLAPEIYTSEGTTRGTVEIPLDLSGIPGAATASVPVPPLEPGARDTLALRFPAAGLDEVSLWVDPDNALPELREGNNVSIWKPDRDRWTLAALHVHSCFSEGPGSFDWQVWHAARSGYDLVWWSEHDWRMSCRDHLESIGFEEDEDLTVKFVDRGAGSRADFTSEEGDDRALLLATGDTGGRARAVVRSDRKRFAYALASGIDLEVQVFARSLQAGDVCDISFELSQHPYHERRLVYRLRYEGTEETAGPAEHDGTRIIPRTVPTGGWVTVRLPVSRDAAAAWPNGADDNLVGLRAELRASGAAEVLLDDFRFRHERCGEELIRIQEAWCRDYPNLAHEVGGEISFTRPHLARYGGDYGLLMQDLERDAEQAGDIQEAERIVRAVHDHGALASWCHPLGATFYSDLGPEEFQELIDAGLAGVDAVEIGYRKRGAWSLDDYVDLWNRTNAAGLVVTALGVNDSHHNQWAPWENNFATWLEAPADDPAAMLRALREGRAFFGDPVRFRGRVSLQVGGTGMGGIVGGEGNRTVRARLSEIGENRTVRLVGDGGAVLREWTGVSGSGVLGEQLAPGAASTVRVEIHDAAGQPLAFTNPVYLDPEGRLGRRGE